MIRPSLALVVAAALATVGAGCDGTPPKSDAPAVEYTLFVVDEVGAPVNNASLELVGRKQAIRVRESAELSLDQPVAGVIRADGYLPEPVVLEPADGSVTVELLALVGPGGSQRRAMHFGGDVMMGRRYQSAEGDATSIATTGEEARKVVDSVAPLMAAADASMVNLETVIGELPTLDAYPAKRFLLQSPPIILEALDELGVDLVTLGNNHAYDWREEGIASTISHLDASGIAWAGAGLDASQAQRGRIITVAGMRVGVVSATTVNGDFVNDSLPTGADQVPADLAAADEWQYERRAFGFGKPGGAAYLPPANRLVGEMWQTFSDLEPDLTEVEAAGLWAAATEVYPELQDWVARRGHGGAAPFESASVADQVAQLRAEGADIVVVQLHGGFQFSEAPSEFLRRAAHDAIDGGADLVVGHHPHVLQGVEWYRGRLIAYSLGNFVFDQDFLSTFPSAMLRTVFEGDTLVQARLVPLVLDGYRPVPASGEAAARVVRLMNARSLNPAVSDRLQPTLVANVLTGTIVGNAFIRRDGGSSIISATPSPATDTIPLDAGSVKPLEECTLMRPNARVPASGELGTDLLSWGSFDDFTADRSSAGAEFWSVDRRTARRYSSERANYLHLESTASSSASTRQIARSTIPEHRWYDADGEPLDGAPRYTLQLAVRRSDEVASIKVVLYDVNDTDPTVEPSSTMLHETTMSMPLSEMDEWRTLTLDLTALLNERYAGIRADAILLYVIAPPGENRVDVDDVRLYEWRQAAELPQGVWTAADAMVATEAGDVTFDVLGCQ